MTDQSLGYYGPPLDDFASTESDFLENFASIPPSAMLSDGIVDISHPEPLQYFDFVSNNCYGTEMMSENADSLQPQIEPNYGLSGSGTVKAKSVGYRTWTPEALDKALKDYSETDIGLSKVRAMYKIPCSTLKFYIKKRGIVKNKVSRKRKWDDATMNRALERIRRGRSIADTSAEFGISETILYRQCRLNKIVLQQVLWSEVDMAKAIAAFRSFQFKNVRQAAVHFNVSYEALRRRLKRAKSAKKPSTK